VLDKEVIFMSQEQKEEPFVINGPLGGRFESEEDRQQRWTQLENMANRRRELAFKKANEGLSQDENIELAQLVGLGSSC